MKRILLLFFILICLSGLFATDYISPNGHTLTYPPSGVGFHIVNYDAINIDLDGTNSLNAFRYNRYVNKDGNYHNVDIRIKKESTDVGSYQFYGDLETISNDEFPTDYVYNTTYLINTNWNGNIITLRSEHLNQQAYQFGVKIELYVDSPPGWADYYETQEDFTELKEDETPQFSVVPMNSVYQNASGDMLYILQQGNATSSIKRPLMIVDGDDPINSKSRYYYWKDHLHTISELTTLNLDLSQYDIYLLTFNDCRIDARINAMATLQATQFVHSLYGNTDVEGTILAGFSLGGILSRYALAFAEQYNIPHYCHQYIAIDSPQRGAMVSWNFLDSINKLNDDVNSLGGEIELQLYALGFSSTSAKQLIRTNANSESNYNGMGNTNADCTDFFSEMNQEDRIQYIQNLNNSAQVNELLNYYNGSSPGQKPGFPYKQNNIQSIAISNGMLEQSGNVNNVPNLVVINTIIPELLFSSNRTVPSLPYDCQPGSTAGLEPVEDRMFNYDIPIAATRSSLYLKNDSKSGLSPTDMQFDISNFTTINTDLKPADWTTEKYIEDHSYYDKVFYKSILGMPLVGSSSGPKWYWRHEVDSQENAVNNVMGKVLQYSSQLSNRAICSISGIVPDADVSNIRVKAYADNVLLPSNPEDEYVHSDGTWKIHYTLLKSANIKIVFEKSGCLPTIRNLYYHYSPLNTIGSIDNIEVHIYPFDYNDIRVSSQTLGSFESVNGALSYLRDLIFGGQIINAPVKINVVSSNEPYTESLDLSFLPSTIPSFSIEGLTPDTMIRGDIRIDSQNQITQFHFKNLSLEYFPFDNIGNSIFKGELSHVCFEECSFTNYDDKYPALFSEVPITISSCEFYNNLGAAIKISNTSAVIENCMIHENAGAFGGALHANTATSIAVKDCSFENNRSTGTGDIPVGTPGGAVYLQNCNNILIDNNQFIGNVTSGAGGPLDITMTTPNSLVSFKIKNNKFINNVPLPIGGIDYRGAIGISFQGCQFTAQDSISYNFIKSTSCPNEFMIAGANCSGQLYVNNCDYIMDTNTESGAIIRTYATLSTRFEYCLFQTGENDAVFAAFLVPGSNTVIHNEIYRSLFNRGYQIVNGPLPSPLINYYNTTNVSDMYLDSNYVPKWDSIRKSPCIDTGKPHQSDPDGTPSDIGCYRAFDHSYESYKFADMDPDKYYWICFPILDTIVNNENLASNFFEELLVTYQNESDITVPEYLDKIIWLEQGSANFIDWIPGDEYNDGSWTSNSTTHLVTSERGYKIKLEGARARTFTESGLLADPQAAITLTPGENWIGYTLKNSSSPEDAFASIWDDLTMIKTKDWCLSRIHDNLWLSSSKRYPLNYGDMVVLTCNSNHSAFHWGDPDLTIEDKKPEAEHFEFPEKEDYFPVYINLNNVNMVGLQEIGLLMNSACKGAVVVTDSLVQLNAFLDVDEVLTADNTEFVFYYEAKNQPQECKTVRLTNSMLKKSFIDGNEAYPVYQISIKGTDFDVPVNTVTSLNQNFPNPFNPATTISYNLKEDTKVALDIYNIRGQLVKTLESGFVTKGKHSVVWEGKDNTGNTCSSGVYLYKLKTGDASITRKMMLLK